MVLKIVQTPSGSYRVSSLSTKKLKAINELALLEKRPRKWELSKDGSRLVLYA